MFPLRVSHHVITPRTSMTIVRRSIKTPNAMLIVASGERVVILFFFLGWNALSVPTDNTDRKSTRLNSSHSQISYAVFCLTKKTLGRNPGDLRHGLLDAHGTPLGRRPGQPSTARLAVRHRLSQSHHPRAQ